MCWLMSRSESFTSITPLDVYKSVQTWFYMVEPHLFYKYLSSLSSVVGFPQEVIGMFTSRDLLSELARYPNKADGLKTKAHKFMIPLSRMIYCSMKDSLYQCLLVMSELKVRYGMVC